MTTRQAREAIKKRWLDLWPTKSGGTPYTFEALPKPQAPVFAVLSVIHTDGDIHTIGPRGKNENPGFIMVRLEGPVGVGTNQVDDLVEAVKQIYQRKHFARRQNDDGISTRKSNVSELTRDKEAPDRWVLTVTTSFVYYDRPDA